MSTTLFDLAAEKLESHSGFDRLEARGTLRLALKSAGLDPKTIDVEQLRVVFEKVMPAELEARGLDCAEAICRTVMQDVASAPLADDADSPSDLDGIFRRLGGD